MEGDVAIVRSGLDAGSGGVDLTPSYQGFFNPDALLNAYGFGWVVSDYRGRTLVEHGGTLKFRILDDLLDEAAR